MDKQARHIGRRATLVGAFVAGVICLAPVSAEAGFFEQLFGGGMAVPVPQAPSPSYGVEQSPTDLIPGSNHRQRPRNKKVARDEKPVLQKTTDLMHDATLRAGDAIMMKTGIHIYAGPETTKHTSRQFSPIDSARHLSKEERTALVAMDMTRNDPMRYETVSDGVVTGRSATVDKPVINQGYRITDARGKSIRYVGP